MTSITAHRDILTQAEAEARAARVTDVAYELAINITEGASTYRGDVSVSFRDHAEGDLFLDFRGKTIASLEINGVAAEPDWTGFRLTLPGGLLAAENHVRVRYENEYDHTGDGFHQFIDPEDGAEYLYTNFEPYEAHRLFPCFDQPDLKATYHLTVDAPAGWVLISNSPEESRESLADNRQRHHFTQTRPFSTYLFALVAGPFAAFRDEHAGIPLGLFCRKSLVQYFDQPELFEVTKQGLDFYADFFDYPYPFSKYDQVFVPEFNAGAMENVGAVVHSEHMVFRDPPTDTQRQGRAETLLHEMAHMWFGNLVTMRWWNDLWLNESFATYMAYLSLVEATRFTNAWQAFNSGMKNWAYRQDQLITTHPIAAEVADTDQTFLNFDGITYGKGASVIKQLVATIGMDAFREGMRRYFQRHAFGNTTLAHFLDALGEGLDLDLHAWARLWLETPSLNTLAVAWESDGSRIAALGLAQAAPPEHHTLRPHRVDIALVREEHGQVRIDTIPARIAGETASVPEAIGRPVPGFVFPNHNDHGFVKVRLDDTSIAWVREHLGLIEDPLLRQLTWQALWNMVRDQQLRSTEYVQLASRHVRQERDHELVETILAHVQAAIGRYVPQEQREAEAHAFSEIAWEMLQSVPAGDDLQIIWARTLFGMALAREDIERCLRLVDGELSVPGLHIDQDMRWEIAARSVAYAMPGAGERVDAERQRDPSDRGLRAALRCSVAVQDLAVKEAAWQRFLGEGYGSLHQTAAAMSGFFWNIQRDLTATYEERFFEAVPKVFREREHEFSRAFFGALFPGHRVERVTLERSEALLRTLGDDQPLLRRMLLEANDDLARAIRCREFAATSS